jgi:hypothetical protein
MRLHRFHKCNEGLNVEQLCPGLIGPHEDSHQGARVDDDDTFRGIPLRASKER